VAASRYFVPTAGIEGACFTIIQIGQFTISDGRITLVEAAFEGTSSDIKGSKAA
jgi:hypothetical protein